MKKLGFGLMRLPLTNDWQRLSRALRPLLTCDDNNMLALMIGFICPAFVIKTDDAAKGTALFETLYDAMPDDKDGTEPMMNILAWSENGGFISVIIPRSKHRPPRLLLCR